MPEHMLLLTSIIDDEIYELIITLNIVSTKTVLHREGDIALFLINKKKIKFRVYFSINKDKDYLSQLKLIGII